jgi:hypothetical protein
MKNNQIFQMSCLQAKTSNLCLLITSNNNNRIFWQKLPHSIIRLLLFYFRVIVLNNITDLKKIIAESSQNNKMDILISLRAFLADQEDYPWVYFKNIEEIPDVFSYLH